MLQALLDYLPKRYFAGIQNQSMASIRNELASKPQLPFASAGKPYGCYLLKNLAWHRPTGIDHA